MPSAKIVAQKPAGSVNPLSSLGHPWLSALRAALDRYRAWLQAACVPLTKKKTATAQETSAKNPTRRFMFPPEGPVQLCSVPPLTRAIESNARRSVLRTRDSISEEPSRKSIASGERVRPDIESSFRLARLAFISCAAASPSVSRVKALRYGNQNPRMRPPSRRPDICPLRCAFGCNHDQRRKPRGNNAHDNLVSALGGPDSPAQFTAGSAICAKKLSNPAGDAVTTAQ